MISADKLPTITAERIVLRWLTERDLDALFAIFSDREVMRFWSSPPLADETAARRLLEGIQESFRNKKLFQWGVARKSDDHVIGTCTLADLDAGNLRAELGFALGREHWGNGYMAEALPVLLDFAFGELKLRRIEADVDPRNTSSIRRIEKLGFQREGYMRERWSVGGELQDSVFYGLLKREWRQLPTPRRGGHTGPTGN